MNTPNTPSSAELHDIVLDALLDVAPDLDRADLGPEVDLRQDLDIDSMDYLNFIVRLHERLAVEIPESDYPRLRTPGGCVEYLQAKLGG